MKFCKYCHTAMEDDAQSCPSCGKPWEPEEAPADAPAAADVTDAPVAQDSPAEEATTEEATADAREVTAAPSSKKKAPVGLLVGLFLTAALAVALVVGKSAYDRSRAESSAPTESMDSQGETGDTAPTQTPVTDEEAAANPALHNNAYGYRSYSVNFAPQEDGTVTYSYLNQDSETVTLDDAQVEALMDQVVATCGSLELTNRELLYYYQQQYYAFYNSLGSYGMYLSYMIDTTKGFDEQLNPMGDGTWQQFFITASLEAFHQTAALYDEAMANGYQLDETAQAALDALADDLNSIAQQYGLADAEAYLDDVFGPAASLETYLRFAEINQIASGYANSLSNAWSFTEQEISDYYDENAQTLQENYGLEKLDQNVVNVRHILIQPEDTESEESWAEAEAEAQRIYDEWKAGEATEESFAALATEYTQDPGSQSTGGLYEDVYPGQMVQPFNDWCFAQGRAVSDSGIVKTDYGYHIMYFSGEGDYVYWKMAVESMLRNEAFSEQLTTLTESYAMTSDEGLCAILDRNTPTVPTAETEGTAGTAEVTESGETAGASETGGNGEADSTTDTAAETDAADAE
ncbi:MAG TPA: peptidylprolyl isomerase [Candidatus Avoscillospira avicola]|uniref:Peptidylprolyl isomerase n=1 Tax=Candidatus Avoscillospira avicola TaxID=2840706 RepID=A0A9D1IXF2_9FIRM|nr:peptidylprolyl isomerase [Candidatus Avoscillospira avicola]